VLGRRALNRATLERQLLLRRWRLPAADAVQQLAGLNAQDPNPAYTALWARLEGFGQDALTGLLYDRRVVRSSLLRGTQHLVSAADFRWLRPTLQPVLDRVRQAGFGRRTAGMDLAELAAAGRALLAGRTLTRPHVGRLLPSGGRTATPTRLPGRCSSWRRWSTLPRAAPGARSAPPPSPWPKTGSTPRWRQRPHRGSWSAVTLRPSARLPSWTCRHGPA
jgi:hypothetical protein